MVFCNPPNNPSLQRLCVGAPQSWTVEQEEKPSQPSEVVQCPSAAAQHNTTAWFFSRKLRVRVANSSLKYWIILHLDTKRCLTELPRNTFGLVLFTVHDGWFLLQWNGSVLAAAAGAVVSVAKIRLQRCIQKRGWRYPDKWMAKKKKSNRRSVETKWKVNVNGRKMWQIIGSKSSARLLMSFRKRVRLNSLATTEEHEAFTGLLSVRCLQRD